MPMTKLWEKAAEWGEKYGDLVYVENVGIPALFIDSYDAASELLDKRSAIYSSRPFILMVCGMQEWGWATSLVPYGDTLRKQRTYLHRFFQSSAVLNYLELQQRETYVMLNGILSSPDNYEKHVRRLPGAVILANVYGYEVQNEDDDRIRLGEDVLRRGGDATQYIFLDFLPWLRYLPEWTPWITFPKVAREGRALSASFRSMPHNVAKKQFLEGTGKENMTSLLLAENMLEDGSFHDEQNISDAASMAFLGGTDTSVTAIMTFVLAILKNPNVQRRAQEEIDKVIGFDRLPSPSDMDSLPYVRGICTEVLRWEVILPSALPHCTTSDDEYKGYHIPAGTMVVPNVWAMSRDPNIYPDPLSFKPERWIPGGTSEGVPSLRPQEYAFGFGRRLCPGQNWAEHIIFIAVSSILATFNIEKAIGPDGTPIPPNDDFFPSGVRSLGASKCKITPRSEKSASLIRQAIATL